MRLMPSTLTAPSVSVGLMPLLISLSMRSSSGPHHISRTAGHEYSVSILHTAFSRCGLGSHPLLTRSSAWVRREIDGGYHQQPSACHHFCDGSTASPYIVSSVIDVQRFVMTGKPHA